jgi:ABC-2 type transport system permease protein
VLEVDALKKSYGSVTAVSFAVPTRWAMDGLEAMTWRGLGLEAALAPIGVLLLFGAVFGGIAVARFNWEAEG